MHSVTFLGKLLSVLSLLGWRGDWFRKLLAAAFPGMCLGWGGAVPALGTVPAVMLEPGSCVSVRNSGMRDVKQLFGLGFSLIWEWRDNVITALGCACC